MPTRTRLIRKKLQKRPNGSTFSRYATIKYPEIPLSEDDVYLTTGTTDRLDLLAHSLYQDVDLWWVIATANPGVVRRDSLCLKPGIEIRIPRDVNGIKSQFEEINSK